MLEDNDCPELYDLRFGSGVVLEEDGVTLFRLAGPGDCPEDMGLIVGKSGWGVGGACEIRFWGRGGAGGMIDMRFILRASVGLIVRAPSPVACTDIRRFVPPGVTVLPGVVRPAGVRLGVLAPEEERLWSGVREGVRRSFEGRLGVSNDLTLLARGDAVAFVASPPLLSPPRLASLIESAF